MTTELAPVEPCRGCDPDATDLGYHLKDCPSWQALPEKLTSMQEIGLAPEGDHALASVPMEIVARVFERPFRLEAHVELTALAPPVGATKPRNLPIGQYGVAVVGKATPEMLLAIVANIIAQAPTAAAAVHQLRLEISGWTFESSTGERG